MNTDLHREVYPRLLNDFSFKEGKEFLRQGVCPDCGKKELYTSAEHPWVLRCGRLNKCGAEIHIKELYQDLFESWSDRYQPTPQNPNAAADAYLRDARGFDISSLSGWYSQQSYYNSKIDAGTATVRFNLANGSYWERLIDRPSRFGKMKANFHGPYQGLWWVPPAIDFSGLTSKDELWLTEGIFDAIALHQNGVNSVSLMTCNNYPEHALRELSELLPENGRPTLVFALDDGLAGEKYTKKFVKRAKEDGWKATAAQPPKGKLKLDWNELHQRDRLNKKDLETYRYYGKLLIASSPTEKAMLVHGHTGMNEFDLVFDNRLYWFKLDFDRYMKAFNHIADTTPEEEGLTEEDIKIKALQESGTIKEICSCNPQALYFQANELTDESWYYFRVNFPHDGMAIKNTFTGGQISAAAEFKKRLLSIAPGAVWTGTGGQLDSFVKRQIFNIKRVQTVDFVGYSKEYQAYVFNDLAIKNGVMHRLNEEDFFDVGKLSIKSLNHSVSLQINSELKQLNNNWPRMLWTAFGAKGFIALSFWFGSFFAEQIRDKQKSYPFLEIVGEPGSGKSTLIEFMWKLSGRRDYEGFDPSKSTLAARARNFAQVSNMPVVLIEGDRGQEGKDSKKGGFDWDELKTAYNGRSVRARGLRNSGNETYEPPFRGAIVIAQNAEVNASEAVLQRIIHLYTDRSSQNTRTKAAAEELERIPTEYVSGFILKAAMAERDVMSCFEAKFIAYEKQLTEHPELRNVRIIKNHAQLMALVDCLAIVADINAEQQEETRAELVSMAIARQLAVNADHPMVQEFWDVFDYLDGGDSPELNHSRDDNLIAVNLNHFIQIAADRRQQIPPITELKRVLKTSRYRKFLEIRTVNSQVNDWYNKKYPMAERRPLTVKCWVFQRES
ncbi:MAG: toprim domain-containing protein [Yersinia sp. (in: enterobacteria)]